MDALSTVVGRDDIVRHAQRAVDAAVGGRGGLVLLTGEAGIGKIDGRRRSRGACRSAGSPGRLGVVLAR